MRIIYLFVALLASNLSYAQCSQIGAVDVGVTRNYNIASTATRIHWNVSAHGTVIGENAGTIITIQWTQAGEATLAVDYYINGTRYTQCYSVPVLSPLNGGTIGSSIQTFVTNQVLSYTSFRNVQSASGSWGAFNNTPYNYQWEESYNENDWLPVSGAISRDCTGSTFFDRKLFIRRKVTNSTSVAYSNIISVDLVSLLNGGEITAPQIIQPGSIPAKLVTLTNASGGAGGYTFQWETSEDETNWNIITGATGGDYQPPALTQTTYFRRKVFSSGQSAASNSVQILVKSLASVNMPDATVVQGSEPVISPPNYTSLNTSNLNSIISYTVLRPGISTPEQAKGLTGKRDIMKGTVYVDGLKRELESVAQNIGPASEDLVSFMQYDQYGRQLLSHLPYLAHTDANQKGKFRTDIQTAQPTFYNNFTQNKENFFYGRSVPEASPASGTVKDFIPGKSYSGSNTGTTESVRINNASEHVRIWRIKDDDVPVSHAEYQPGTLTVRVITDVENTRSCQYSDQNGKIVMCSRQGITPACQDELRTYYVYDDMDNLRYILPPMAIKSFGDSPSWDFGGNNALKNLCYKYYYDAKGRVVSMEKAGIDARSDIVYDNRNRPVLLRDAGLISRNKGEWLLYFYDGLDRVVMVALYTNTAASRESLQALMDQASGSTGITVRTPLSPDLFIYNNENKPQYVASKSVNFLGNFDSGDNAGFDAYTDISATETTERFTVNNPLPGLSNYTPLIIYYYDNYAWEGALSFDRHFSLDAGGNPYAEIAYSPSANTAGKLTGYKTSIPGKTGWTRSTLYYDDKGRILQQLATNVTGGTDVTSYLYDYNGKLLSSFSRISNPLSVKDPLIYVRQRIEYDDNGNIKQKYHYAGNNSTPTDKLVAEYAYDELNRVKTVILSQGLETLHYDYDLQGRVKGVNSSYATGRTGGNYFGMELSYDNGFSSRKLDGNISGVIWRRKGDGDAAHAYGYIYDTHNRLTKAAYSQNSSGNWNSSEEDYSVDIPKYDDNGNILKMKEDGMLPGKVKTTIDDLTYHYTPSSNRLSGVTDTQGNKEQNDFRNYSGRNDTTDYTYDVAGNLLTDKNRGIRLTYNYLLGKPERLEVSNDAGKYISYVRDIKGNLLQRIVNNGSVQNTYTYLGGAVYKNNELQFILSDEGRIRKNAAGDFIYDYFLTDHLGNTRTVITEETNQYYYKASHEDNPNPAPVLPERELFGFPAVVDDIPSNHKFYDYNGNQNRKFIRLNYNDVNRRIGTGKVLRVMADDQLELGVLSYYQTNSPDNNTPDKPVNEIVNQLVNVLLGPSSVVSNGKGNLLEGVNGIILNQQDFSTFVRNNQNDNPASTVPKAYLNYTLFDDHFQFVNGGAIRVSQPGEVAALASQLRVSKNGYLYVYTSNESGTDVYFDDLVVKHNTGHLLQENSYYPFGLQIKGLSSAAMNRPQNNYLYNGIEKVSEFDLELYDAFYRTLDPQIGRWLQIDPVSAKYASISGYNSNFNNPVNFADPLGDDPPGWLKSLKRLVGKFTDWVGGGSEVNDVINLGHPVQLNGITVSPDASLSIESALVTNSGIFEGPRTFTTSSYLALDAAIKRKELLQQAAALRSLSTTLHKLYGNNIPAAPSANIGTVKEYIPDWKDNWAASDNFFAKVTYEPVDGAWTTFQSLNPFLDRSAISHIDGRMVTEVERVRGFVNVTSTFATDYAGGQAFKAVVPLLASLPAKVITAGRFPRLDYKFGRHADEWSQWGSISKAAYYSRAIRLAESEVGGNIMGFTSKKGWIFRFNSATEEFLTVHPSGYIETFFRPEEGLKYFLNQIRKYGN
ncbi:DUF6443 domain-containing protein [Chitinophaga tropicalis]|uniref:DUF6443 domain-containing protein n=1 Tax=Chitinophaga tropicalis TaxID=2683588 RepID=A0A7K1U0Z9_9BACT|nr:DUF6443 domain-containing protein [Chitinophaga tropicalis]MVT07966.1 hypothetical protein [Chitinophaga tropicalis]